VTFKQLAEGCHVSELDMRRILRFATFTHRVFCEPEKGVVAHTASSHLLVESQQHWDMAGLARDEDWPAFARVSLRSPSPSCVNCLLTIDRLRDGEVGRYGAKSHGNFPTQVQEST
jgi:hypothetical protein